MFCSEKIRKVFWVFRNAADEYGNNSGFRFSPYVELLIMKGVWLVLQTERFFITMGENGVQLLNDLSDYSKEEYYFESFDEKHDDPPNISIETAIFTGERLHSVQQEDGTYLLRFDHFTMRFPIQKKIGIIWQSRDVPVPALQRYLTRKCSCGGRGEVMLEHTDDFIARCGQCHRSTWATFDCMAVIRDWNRGDTPIEYQTGMECFLTYASMPVKSIYMSKEYICYGDNLYDCESVMLEIGDKIFKLSSQPASADDECFYISSHSRFNHDLWPYLIQATEQRPIIPMEPECKEDRESCLCYRIGNRELAIMARDPNGWLSLGWTHCDGEYCEDEDFLFEAMFGKKNDHL